MRGYQRGKKCHVLFEWPFSLHLSFADCKNAGKDIIFYIFANSFFPHVSLSVTNIRRRAHLRELLTFYILLHIHPIQHSFLRFLTKVIRNPAKQKKRTTFVIQEIFEYNLD